MRGNGHLGLAALAAGRERVLGAEGRRVLVVEPAALARRRRQQLVALLDDLLDLRREARRDLDLLELRHARPQSRRLVPQSQELGLGLGLVALRRGDARVGLELHALGVLFNLPLARGKIGINRREFLGLPS